LKRYATLALVVAALAGCSLLIDLHDLPPDTLGDAADVVVDSTQPQPDGSDAASDVVVDAAPDVEDPADCGPTHLICGSKRCVNESCVRRVFVSSTVYQGNFGNVFNADNTCSNLGFAIGDFMAIMSVTDAGAKERMGPSNAPFILLDGPSTEIAKNAAALFSDGGIEHPVNVTEDGGVVDASVAFVWTGTGTNGEPDPSNRCLDWLAGDPNTAGVGLVTNQDTAWLYSQARACSSLAHFYCVEK